MKKNTYFYIITILISVLLGWFISSAGLKLEKPDSLKPKNQFTQSIPTEIEKKSTASKFLEELTHNTKHPLSMILIQIIIVVMAARIFGIFFVKIKQPLVIGEIVAGIVLGPSALGYFFPELYNYLFTPSSLSVLQIVSQIGLVLFMFVIGMELDINVIKNKADTAVVVSHSSIVVPFIMGMALSLYLYPKYGVDYTTFLSFSLFMGIAMSITAFPVLARILQERNLTKTKMGIMAISCAAADDVTAWSILAIIVTLVKAGNITTSLFTIAISLLYVVVMIKLVQPFLNRLSLIYVSRENLTKGVVVFIFLFLFISALVTELIGIHALFGAFLAGTIMPSRNNLKHLITEKIHDFSLFILLPLFFAFTGLRTKIGLLNQPDLWISCGLIISVAVISKFGGSSLSARYVGESWKDSLSIGVLMNTRGLMELVVLNIGYDLGILSPEIFAMMVLMALITTFLTGPSLDIINKLFKDVDDTVEAKVSTILSFARPEMGVKLLKLSAILQPIKKVRAVHFTPRDYLSQKESDQYFQESFKEIIKSSQKLNIHLDTYYKPTEDILSAIVEQVKTYQPNILLMGSAQSVFTDDIISGKVKNILSMVDCPVGILLDRDLNSYERVLVIRKDSNDLKILNMLQKNELDCPIDLITVDESQTSIGLPKGYNQLTVKSKDINYFQFSLVMMDVELWSEYKALMNTSCLLFKFP